MISNEVRALTSTSIQKNMKVDPFKILNILISIMIFLICSIFIRQIIIWQYSPLVKKIGVVSLGAKIEANSKKDFFQYIPISNSGLFGTQKIRLIENSRPLGENLDAIAIDMVLIGTIIERSGLSYAIFQTSQSKKQKIFSKGEEVFNFGILNKIQDNSVVIKANGKLLTIYMLGSRPPENVSDELKQESHSLWGTKVLKESDTHRIIDQNVFNNIMSKMDQVLTDAKLLPYTENGQITGFRMTEINPDGFFSQLGLKNYDILVKINDYNMDSPEKGLQLLSGLKGEDSISLEILRNKKPLKLNYQIR